MASCLTCIRITVEIDLTTGRRSSMTDEALHGPGDMMNWLSMIRTGTCPFLRSHIAWDTLSVRQTWTAR